MPAEVFDRSEGPELWLDYVADLGDGWNSTYTVASLLAAEELELEWDGRDLRHRAGPDPGHGRRPGVPGAQAGRVREPPARPLPGRPALHRRTTRRPSCSPSPAATTGTTAWSTSPASSAATGGSAAGGPASAGATSPSSCPHGWWLWGIDIQFGSYIDEAQLQYFADVARDRVRARRPHRPVHGQGGRQRPERRRDPLRPRRRLPRARGHPAQRRPADRSSSRAASTTTPATRRRTAPASTSPPAAAAPSCTPPTGCPTAWTCRARRGTTCYRQGRHAIRRRRRRSGCASGCGCSRPTTCPLAGVFGVVQVLLAFMLGLHLRRPPRRPRPRRPAPGAVGEPDRLPADHPHARAPGRRWSASPTTPAASPASCSAWCTRPCSWPAWPR